MSLFDAAKNREENRLYILSLEAERDRLQSELSAAVEAYQSNFSALTRRNEEIDRLKAELITFRINEGEILTENDAMAFKLNMDSQEIFRLTQEVERLKGDNLFHVLKQTQVDRDTWKSKAQEWETRFVKTTATRDTWKARAEKLADHLRWTLPMAGSYANDHQVGSNVDIYLKAKEVLADFERESK